jgi:hypothetical protein
MLMAFLVGGVLVCVLMWLIVLCTTAGAVVGSSLDPSVDAFEVDDVGLHVGLRGQNSFFDPK